MISLLLHTNTWHGRRGVRQTAAQGSGAEISEIVTMRHDILAAAHQLPAGKDEEAGMK